MVNNNAAALNRICWNNCNAVCEFELMYSYATCFQDVSSPFLQLSDLQEGRYMFQLTVTDSRGQQDSDTVSITVLPGKTNPLHLSVCMKKNYASFRTEILLCGSKQSTSRYNRTRQAAPPPSQQHHVEWQRQHWWSGRHQLPMGHAQVPAHCRVITSDVWSMN